MCIYIYIYIYIYVCVCVYILYRYMPVKNNNANRSNAPSCIRLHALLLAGHFSLAADALFLASVIKS